MARNLIFCTLLKEANAIDLNVSRRQNAGIRELNIFYLNTNVIEIYRLSEELIEQLLEDLLLKAPQRRRSGLTIKAKLLCALAFFASGSYQRICGQNIHSFISQPSASRSIHEVVEALCHPDVVKKYIRFPQNAEERLKLKERFYAKYHIPSVIGCVDGTYVAMVRPSNHEERYYCHKGYHARNVQLFTDADLNIIHVDATYGGATHDSFIFNHCIIRDHLEELVQAGESVYLLVSVPCFDQIGDVLKKGQVKSTYNRRVCMKALMKVVEANEVCQDRSMWKEVVSAYPNGKKA